ncbi:MAG: CRTAC1 family protein [Lacipirellulaceae bacterium]
MNSLRTACRMWALAAPLFTLLSTDARAVAFTEQGATILGGANYSARSVSLADIDNDGDLDAYFQGSTSAARQMWRNNVVGTGAFTFTNVSSTMLPSGLSASWSSAWADYNGDGRVDVFVGQENSSSNTGSVLRNNGTSFLNASSSTGLNDPGFHQNVGWADIDNDLDLDLLIGMEGPTEKHEVYLQGASGAFTPVGAATGFQVAFGTKAYGMAIGDSDGDGDLDVYISTCRSGGDIRNNFFKNLLVETGSLAFVDVADSNGTQNLNNTYGTEFLDFDNDGDLDLYVTGADGEDTKIFRNNGGNQFTDVDTFTGRALLSDNGVDLNGSKAVDYDNDGDLDLYFHDNLSATGNQRMFRNDGGWTFTDVTVTAGLHVAAGGAPVGAGGYDSAWGDLDRDGDQDLITPNNSTLGGTTPTPERVYVSNATTNGNDWLYVELKGPTSNTTGLGASLYATIDGGSLDGVTLRREANTNPGTFNQSDLPVHFGLASATLVEELRVVWPDGKKQSLRNVAPNQYLTVRYLPGDYNGDGVVNAADFTVWRDGLGSVYTQGDYAVWRDNYGSALPAVSSAEATPEPATLALALLGVAASSGRRASQRA